MLWGDLALFILFVILLIISALLCVRSLTKISLFLRLSEFLVGFVIMGISTALPELFVGITSAFNKNPSMALGNVIGSVIVNLTLVAGIIVVLARGIETKKGDVRKDALRLFVLALVPIILMILGNGLSRLDGAILVGLFIFNIYSLIKERKSYREKIADHVGRAHAIGYSFLFIFSIFGLFFTAQGTVKYGGLIAEGFGLPQIFIGLFFVALGTSLPELVFGIMATRTQHAIMSLGDLIGACIVNVTLVLGITALIFPIKTGFTLFLTSSLFMLLITFIFMTFIESGRKIDWKEGIALIFLYVFF